MLANGIDQERLRQTLVDLVQINSPSRQEEAAVAYVRAALTAIGLASDVDGVNNVYARLPARRSAAAPLLVNAHVDTVQPTPQIKVRLDGDVLRTDGSTILGADDKAGVAAILEVLRTLQASDVPHAALEILFTVQEEIGLYGAKAVQYDRLTAREGICLDASGPAHHLVVAAPGQNSLEAAFIGKSAHAGVAPELGKSAIQAAARAIAAMPLGRIDAETTANIGIIHGGQARNIVPDRCEITGEARSRDGAKLARQTEAMVAALQQAAEQGGCRLDLTVTDSYSAFSYDATSPIVRRCQAAIRTLGNEPELTATG
ncbi:MAG TPA: M20/M25/M40 family metallo-hydrolase, partial [Chloroflexota bacterium]|nr:M20/M25/M40 family metallo-hydrolase [Chloroflexota bacterium]